MASPDGLRLYFGSHLPDEVLELSFQYGFHLWLAKPHLAVAWAVNSASDLMAWELSTTVYVAPERFSSGVSASLWFKYEKFALGEFAGVGCIRGLKRPYVFSRRHRYRWTQLPNGRWVLARSLDRPLLTGRTSTTRVFHMQERQWRNNCSLREPPWRSEDVV